MFKKVHLVFGNKHLMERDRADFKDLWRLAGCENQVEYHVGCDFEPEENSLILIDESDGSCLNRQRPSRTSLRISFASASLQLRATATSKESRLKWSKLSVSSNIATCPDNFLLVVLLDYSSTKWIKLPTLEQKVEVVRSLLKQGSVLAYAL